MHATNRSRGYERLVLLACLVLANRACQLGHGGSFCHPCGIGRFKDVTGHGICNGCLSDATTLQTGSTSRSQCLCIPGTSTYMLMGLALCARCTEGKFQASYGAASCDNCPSGKYTGVRTFNASEQGSEDFCLSCPANTGNSPPGSLFASDCTCNAGSSRPVGALCSSCEAGTYSTSTNSLTCTPCQDNAWSPVASTRCECKADWMTTAAGQPCTQCGISMFKLLPGDVACEKCGVGKYRADHNTLACTPCAAGKHNAATSANSASMCLPCPPGTFTSDDGSKCVVCPKSYAASVLTDAFVAQKVFTACVEFVEL